MRRLILASALLAAAGAAFAQPQPERDFEHPVIAVTGAARATRPADFAEIHVELRGDGRTQVEALRALKAQQDTVTDGVSRLEGVTRVNVRNPATHVVETYGAACERARDRARTRPTGECAPTGYVAYISARMKVWPADRAGQVVSIAAERGAIGARLEESGIDDPQALRREAVAAAVREARLQAEAVAKASGVVLGPLERVFDSEARASLARSDDVESLVVTGSRIRPGVSLNVTPEPVAHDARVTAVFRIGR